MKDVNGFNEYDEYDGIFVTNHANKRSRERCGLNRSAAERNAVKAFAFGLRECDATGKLKKYIMSKYEGKKENNKCEIIIYNRYVYVFDDLNFITIYPLPKELFATADKHQRRMMAA